MEYILILVFIVATFVGYILIGNVPSLLHTPLMSGMNALSGITILGTLVAFADAIKGEYKIWGYVFGSLAIILSMINVVGGFAVTDRMLELFKEKKDE